MSDVPCPKWLRGEVEPLLNEDLDCREVMVSQGVLRKCLWHLTQYERLTAESKADKIRLADMEATCEFLHETEADNERLTAALEQLAKPSALRDEEDMSLIAREALAAVEGKDDE